MRSLTKLAAICFLITNAVADDKVFDYQAAYGNLQSTPSKELTVDCIKKAAEAYGIHPDILIAILIVEGGANGVVSKNRNGSYDLGAFQINTINLPSLNKDFGISKDEIKYDACLSASIAARHILQSLIGAKFDGTYESYLSAIARYHSKSPVENKIYAQKLRAAFNQLYGGK